MIFRPKLLLGVLLALCAGALARGQSLSVTGVTVEPSSTTPNKSVTLHLAVSNASTGSSFAASGTASFSITFTHKVTGYTFTRTASNITPTTLIPAATAGDATTPSTPGSGTFDATILVPGQTTQAGQYTAAVTITGASTGPGTFSSQAFVSSNTVLTVTGKPDLKITSLTYTASTSYVGGNVITMALTYRNKPASTNTDNVPFVGSLANSRQAFRIQVVLSSNPTFGDADDFQLTFFDVGGNSNGATNGVVNADDVDHSIPWNQLLPGNFAGSYYVLAKIDSLDEVSETIENDLSDNGNNIWQDVAGTRIALQPSTFPTIYLASTTTTGASGAGYSDNPSITTDGRYTSFASDAADLVSGDSNGTRDIFLFDQQNNLVRRLSLSQQGAQANGASNNPAISGNGRYVAFSSDATNLVLGDVNGFTDIFIVDTITGAISLQSVATGGTQANSSSFRPSVSQDGRYLVFESSATNLASSATATGVTHIYLRDRDVSGSGTFDTSGNTSTTLIDVSGSTPGNASAVQAQISADARYVVFASKATNLAASATTVGRQHIYLRDRTSATTTLVDAGVAGAESNADSRNPSISRNTGVTTGIGADGRHVAFASDATNLIAGDTNTVSDIFAWDRVTSAIVRVSVSSAGAEGTDPTVSNVSGSHLGSINPSISATGRYVTFASLDDNLAPGDIVGRYLLSGSGNGSLNVYVMDRDVNATGTYDTGGNISTTDVSVNRFGYQANQILNVQSTAAADIFPVISADGRWVAFPFDAEGSNGLIHTTTNQLSPDRNSARDVAVFDRRTNSLPNQSNVPTVSITSPGTGNSVLVNTATPITASATATVGVVASVQFYVNGTSLGTSTIFPYTQTWTPTAVGTYTLSALVTDSFGNQAVSANVTISVNAAPSVGITTPGDATTITLGSSQAIQATAVPTTPGATISNVVFKVNGSTIATVNSAPYTTTWTPGATGTYTLTAVATDSNNVATTSPAVTVTVTSTSGPTNAPSVSLTSPTAGAAYVVGNTIAVAASASLGTGVLQSVTFYVNGISIGSSGAVPFAATYTPSAAGDYTFTAVAADSSGNQTTSSPVIVSVVNANAPTVAVSSPASGTTLPVNVAQMLVATAASSSASISRVDFFANNVAVGSDPTFPYTVSWTPNSVGTFRITAVATDSLGQQSTSAPVSYTVSAGTPPGVSITSPGNGSSFPVANPVSVVVSANSSTSTVASVQLFANGVSLGAKSTFPYTFTWTPSAAGNYSLTAIATDALGGIATSTAVSVTIGGNSAPTISLITPTSGQSYSLGTGVLLAASAGDSDGTLANVKFFANGILLGTVSSLPYTYSWVPQSTGTFQITAMATDNLGNVTTTSQVAVTVTSSGSASVSLTTPATGSTYPVSTTIPLAATATGGNGAIVQVQFLVNGLVATTDSSAPYTGSWTPTATGTYSVVAVATDSAGVTALSSPVIVTISGNNAPTVAFTSPTTDVTINAGTALNLAAIATDADGTVSSVRFLANGITIGSSSSAPYTASWTPTAAGAYSVVAQATDNSGNVTSSRALLITVVGNQLPTVSITSPRTGTGVTVGSATTITASASDSDGTIASVQFYANGAQLGSVSTPPYSVNWTPTAEGYYRLSAVAIDNAGAAVSSTTVLVIASVSGTGSVDTVYSGLWIKDFESGTFALTTLHGQAVTLIGYVPTSAGSDAVSRVYYFANVPVDSAGYFELVGSSGTTISGQVSASGVSGTFKDGASSVIFAGSTTARKTNVAPPGYFSGSLSDHPASALSGFIGSDGVLTLYVKDGTFADAGAATVNATSGAFTVNTRAGSKITGTINSTTGFINGTLTKAGSSTADTFTGAQASGTAFGDGSLMNISSRGWVGSGDNVMIAGFVVNGTRAKQVLIRAGGPALVAKGYLSGGVLADPKLSIYKEGVLVASNDNWGGGAGLATAAVQVGAFDYPVPSSLDAVLLVTLAPGVYSAHVASTGAGTGIALVEAYDVDTPTSFAADRVVNISTRGFIGTGDNILIGGFVVGGTSAKKILVQGLGPALTKFGVNGTLADPVLKIFTASGKIVRENDDWTTGNDEALVNEATTKTGATPMSSGSKDAAILITLPPGAYSAQLSGSGSATGVGLIAVYEVQ